MLVSKNFFKNKLAFILFSLIVCSGFVNAQTTELSRYDELSSFYYKKKSDSLKKKTECPVLFKDKKTQAKYKEIWDSKRDFLITSIENNSYIYNKEIYDYLWQIVNQIVASNKKLITEPPVLLIDRSSSANAYALGNNIIAVNLGLILFAQSKEEIAAVIAHELSHNIFKHSENFMKEKAELLTSDEYKNTLNSVLNSQYERYSKLKKIFEDYSFNRSRHQRYHEGDADSLAIILLKNSNIPFDATFFLRLDSTDLHYKQDLQKPIKEYFATHNLPFEDWWIKKNTKGLSAKKYNFKDTTTMTDSLKTHPDCIERYNKTKLQSYNVQIKTPIPTSIKEKANKLLIWNMFDNMALTQCMYRIFQEKDKGNTDPWYDFMLYNVFAGLYYNDLMLKRFTAIGVIPKEYIASTYYQLQTMLEQVPKNNLKEYYNLLNEAKFWKTMPADAKGLKEFFASLITNQETPNYPAFKTSIKNFSAAYPTSMYSEFVNHF